MRGPFCCHGTLAGAPRVPPLVGRCFAAARNVHSQNPNLQLIHRFYDDLWNKFDKSISADILDQSLVFRGSLGQVKHGLQEFGQYVDFVRSAFPDFHNDIVETITEGNKTFVRLRYTGTHSGTVFGVTPTGRKVEYAGAAVFTVAEGKIKEVWVLGDLHGLLEQIKP